MSAFLNQQSYLAAGVYLSETPDNPPPPPVPHCKKTYRTSVLIHIGKEGKGGGGRGEPVRRLEGRQFTRGVANTNMTDQSINSIKHQ
jgi:hypothetical protein